ncbi:hypothetical protein SDC9_83322 [bioreactor metagenome]|uniref:Uncharacterized protein n=1 Tax=bioreactor metagenome TaxID=1076179 RepID=A0A644Z7A8_9ZZZZ
MRRVIQDIGELVAGHTFISHGKGKYVNAVDGSVHTNTSEGFFSVFKRGMKGVCQHSEHNPRIATLPSSISATTIVPLTAWRYHARRKHLVGRDGQSTYISKNYLTRTVIQSEIE